VICIFCYDGVSFMASSSIYNRVTHEFHCYFIFFAFFVYVVIIFFSFRLMLFVALLAFMKLIIR
jgi:hypothetical protein